MPRSEAGELSAFLRLQLGLMRHEGVGRAIRSNLDMLRSRAAGRRALENDYYRVISERELRVLKSSDRAFVFGSGYSLNDITPEEWRSIANDTTIGFNVFVFQKWVRVDFHLVRGWGLGAGPETVPDQVKEFAFLVAGNPCFTDAVFACQDDYTAVFAHWLLAYHGLPKNVRVFNYHTNRTRQIPTRAFADGLVHATSTLCDAINFASCLGFKEVVLVGVDLYDSRYFWLAPDKTVATDYRTGKLVVQDTSHRGQRFDKPHSTVTNGIVELMARWYQHLKEDDVRLSVYNPKSLLADVMPIYDRPGVRGA